MSPIAIERLQPYHDVLLELQSELQKQKGFSVDWQSRVTFFPAEEPALVHRDHARLRGHRRRRDGRGARPQVGGLGRLENRGRVRVVVGSGLEQGDGQRGSLAQSSREHGPRRAAAHDDDTPDCVIQGCLRSSGSGAVQLPRSTRRPGAPLAAALLAVLLPALRGVGELGRVPGAGLDVLHQRADLRSLQLVAHALELLEETTVQRDQVQDYARRLGLEVAEVERWLQSNLAYDPDE